MYNLFIFIFSWHINIVYDIEPIYIKLKYFYLRPYDLISKSTPDMLFNNC